MNSIKSFFGRSAPQLDEATKTLVLNSIAKDWRGYQNANGEIKRKCLNGANGIYDSFFIRLAIRIMEIEKAKSFESLSKQGILRLIASYSAFLPWDGFYLAKGLPKRVDIYERALTSLGRDPFKKIIEEQSEACTSAAAERRKQGEEQSALFNKFIQHKLPFDGKDLLDEVKNMNKDDWHGLVLSLHYGYSENIMSWLAIQPNLDRGTAVRFVFDSDLLPDIASSSSLHEVKDALDYISIVRRVVKNVIDGFYEEHEFAAYDDPDDVILFDSIRRDIADKWGASFNIPREALFQPSRREPKARYSFDDNKIIYNFEYWKTHLNLS